MTTAALALVLFGVYMLLAFVLRTAIQVRRTGSSGFRGISGELGSAEWVGGVLFVVALLIGVAAPAAGLLDVVEPIAPLDGGFGHAAGVGLFAVGLLSTLVAQVSMGSSWRIGVDPGERTDLVTDGPFSIVRNPIFSGMIPTSVGLALLVPNVIAVAGLVALFTALEIQIRLVEEPYLLATHGEQYASYAARVGRFFPGLGRLPGGATSTSPTP